MEKKWEVKVSTFVQSTKANQIWPHFKDFFNIHKYLSSLSNSYGIHGINGELGCIRFCLGSSIPSTTNNISGEKEVSWTKERLIAVDDENMSLSYEILESNIGFNSYVSTVKITQGVDHHRYHDCGCLIEWSFTVDPIEGLRFEDLVDKYQLGLQRITKAMEENLNIIR